MKTIHRIQIVGSVVTLTAIFTHSHLWGDAGDKVHSIGGSKTVPAKMERAAPLAEDVERAKFSRPGVVSYTTLEGVNLFGLQIKPKLNAVERQGADVLIMVDTSASQVGIPLRLATEIAELYARQAGANDHVALWTVNTPGATHKLTTGFKAARGTDVEKAFKALRDEVPLGNTDLHNGLTQGSTCSRIRDARGPGRSSSSAMATAPTTRSAVRNGARSAIS